MTAHRIDQLQVELRCESEDAAQPLMDRVAALRTRGLSALIDQVCGAASPPGRLHRIGRLEIDLGTLPADGMEDALLQRLAPALQQALARALQAEPAGQDQTSILFGNSGNGNTTYPVRVTTTVGSTNTTPAVSVISTSKPSSVGKLP